MKPDGGSLIGFGSSGPGGKSFQAFDPAKDEYIEPHFLSARTEDVERAVRLASEAAPAWSRLTGSDRQKFLEAIARNLEGKVDDLTARAHRETGLPLERLKGEVARTAGQLRLYGAAAARGDWLDARIETCPSPITARCSGRSARSWSSARATSPLRIRWRAATRPRRSRPGAR
jgi:2,5-dioxopentanoate dehydrogenase